MEGFFSLPAHPTYHMTFLFTPPTHPHITWPTQSPFSSHIQQWPIYPPLCCLQVEPDHAHLRTITREHCTWNSFPYSFVILICIPKKVKTPYYTPSLCTFCRLSYDQAHLRTIRRGNSAHTYGIPNHNPLAC